MAANRQAKGRARTAERLPRPLRVVIAGGGVAALEATLALKSLAAGLVDVELIAPEHHFWYRPLAVAEPFAAGRAHAFELAGLARDAGAHFTPGELAAVNPEARVVTLASGAHVSYDFLVVAVGARSQTALRGALTFRGPADSVRFGALLEELERGAVQRVAFAVPGGVVWPLPLYELALMTAAQLRRRGVSGVSLALVTHEPAPLAIFGRAGSDAVATALEASGIYTFCGCYAVRFADDELTVMPRGAIPADRVVALPRLAGINIAGLPQDADGFLPTDEHGRVRALERVFAAGDGTSFPVKQGGLAAQQADAVAESIAAHAGAKVDPRPFRPVLRGLLLTGGAPRYLRAELDGGHGETSVVADEELWWPPGKIVGRYLAPFLAARANIGADPPAGHAAVSVDVDLSDLQDGSARATVAEGGR